MSILTIGIYVNMIKNTIEVEYTVPISKGDNLKLDQGTPYGGKYNKESKKSGCC